jgi:hypothetical protein
LMIINGYKMFINNIKSRGEYNGLEGIIKKRKPFYVSVSSWREIRNDAIEKLFDKDRYLKSSLSYKVLVEAKDNNITENEWIEIINAAQHEFKNLIERECLNDYNITDELLNFKKPRNYDEVEWNKVVKTISYAFSIKVIRELGYKNITKVQKFLNSEKPSNVTQKIWDDLIDETEDILIYDLVREMTQQNDAVDYLKNKDIKLKNKDKNEKILKIAKDLLELNQFKAVYNQLRNIINGHNIDKTKPEEITGSEWQELELLNRRLEDINQKAQDRHEEAKEIERELKPLMKKVTEQLNIIDKVLDDPEFIDKIESYNNVFSPGNFSNLRKLSLRNKENLS